MVAKRDMDMAWLVTQIREQFPAVVIDDPGMSKGGGWMVDMQLGDRLVVVQWTKSGGYGVSRVLDDEPYGLPPDEAFPRAETALLRVCQLFAPPVEMRLQQLRKHRSVSQEDLAKALSVGQSSVSQTEARSDIMISTLQNYIEALGGELQVLARFPHEVIELEFKTAQPVDRAELGVNERSRHGRHHQEGQALRSRAQRQVAQASACHARLARDRGDR